MAYRVWAAALSLLTAGTSSFALAQAQPDALAKAFGARETIISASLSADGSKIALVTAGGARTTRVMVLDAKEGTEPKTVAASSGKPEYLRSCDWVADNRLACQLSGETRYGDDVYGFSNMFAVDAAGGNVKPLSQRRGSNALGFDFRGGWIVDLLPDENGSVLMARSYVPEAKIGSLIEKSLEGLGVDRIDTRSGASRHVERARKSIIDYISDGRGTVRVMASNERSDAGYDRGEIKFSYRAKGSEEWRPLSTYDQNKRTGFYPVAVDADKDVVLGYEKIDGRQALVSVALNPGLTKTVVFAHPRVDVGGVIKVGRDQRPVGVHYVEEYGEAYYFDPDVKAMTVALGKALGGKAVHIGDMSADRQKMLIWAGSDIDPGQYYLYDKAAKKLSPINPDRPELTGRVFSPMKPVQYRAGDGTMIPAYITMPPGKESAKGLPAIVMPHGGPESRDAWGFDWLSQYYAARGFVVIQPEFRGSAGFGEQWLVNNGFRSWRKAIGDVVDAGRWLVAEGIADPNHLTIAGWSYGGYAALQAQAIDPKLFKAVVAIAPVTDLGDMVRRRQDWSDYYQLKQYLGTGSILGEASPSSYAAQFQAPVLMFHGTDDGNVDISQARIMQGKLQGAGKRSELIVYDGLTHQLNDSDARAEMLQKSADFLMAAGK
jgi:acetyl esterase/lipase